MSIVDDQVRRLDAALDRIQLAAAEEATEEYAVAGPSASDTVSRSKLKSLIRSLSTTAGTRPLLKKRRLRDTVTQLQRSDTDEQVTISSEDVDLEWLAVGKATVQVYGVVLNTLLDQTIPLSESIWYWDDILGSYAYTGLYTLQTAPIRWLRSAKEVYADAKEKYVANRSIRAAAEQGRQTLSEGWKEFYDLVGKSIEDRDLLHARTKILSPFALCRTEARQKQENIKNLREQSATAIGLLAEEGLNFQEEDWKDTIVKGIRLLEGITTHTQSFKPRWTDLEEQLVHLIVQPVPEAGPHQWVDNLVDILDVHIPQQERESRRMVKEYGKPSRFVRYWIPGLLLLLSGSTLLRVFFTRRQDIITWIREFGETTIDFWYNWIVDPVKRLIGTIRHDENSELAIMSKDSLVSDRESLERMVVDFAVQHPENGTAYTEAQIADIRGQVKKGDLSTVLKAYEREIQSPAKSAIFGNLIQALLIQVQKTKVDVEVAMNGIDEILKSQELLFGFVGIAPGMVVSWLVVRWLASTVGGRKGLRTASEQNDTIRLLRNIDRTLINATPTDEGMLSYKDNGLLLCEIHVLRQTAAHLIPGVIFNRDFLEDLNDLMNTRQGIERQLKVLARIKNAYGKWMK